MSSKEWDAQHIGSTRKLTRTPEISEVNKRDVRFLTLTMELMEVFNHKVHFAHTFRSWQPFFEPPHATLWNSIEQVSPFGVII